MITEAPRMIDPTGLRYKEGVSRMFLETPPLPLPVALTPTQRHEAKHVVTARRRGIGVDMATSIPGSGYDGLTKLSRPDAVAALAPHATGESGTGHDVFIAKMTGDAGAESEARRIVDANTEAIEAVATALHNYGTIGPSEIDEAMDSVGKPFFKSATLVVETEAGQTIKEEVDVKDDNTITVPQVMLPGEWIVLSTPQEELPLAA